MPWRLPAKPLHIAYRIGVQAVRFPFCTSYPKRVHTQDRICVFAAVLCAVGVSPRVLGEIAHLHWAHASPLVSLHLLRFAERGFVPWPIAQRLGEYEGNVFHFHHLIAQNCPSALGRLAFPFMCAINQKNFFDDFCNLFEESMHLQSVHECTLVACTPHPLQDDLRCNSFAGMTFVSCVLRRLTSFLFVPIMRSLSLEGTHMRQSKWG